MSGNSAIYNVLFEPDNVAITAVENSNLMETAIAAGVHINAACGGHGTCGTCNVFIKQGMVESRPTSKVSAADYEKGVRQSCQSTILTDLIVEIPTTSRLETAVLAKEKTSTLSENQPLATGWQFKPPVTKYCLSLPQPRITDNKSDLTRLLYELEQKHGLTNVDVHFGVVGKLAGVLRVANWQVTVTVLHFQSLISLINIEAGDTRNHHYGLAFDIGTTAVRGQLLDLNRGKIIANAVDYNGQISYGADVISRMAHCNKPGGQSKLRRAVVGTLNKLIQDMLKQSGVDIQYINHMIVAANTVMIHLLLELDPRYLRLSPYVPTVSLPPLVRARDLEIEAAEHVHIYALPSVASYVGGDIVAGILGSGIYQRSAMTLYIDIGTNGEIAVGNCDWMVTAAASAGPTFEGSGIRHGMLATSGAIEDFKLSQEIEPILFTIGSEKPKGICGSGLINIAAVMLKAGVISQNGKFNTDLPTKRIRRSEDGYEYVLAWANESHDNHEIVFTEIDIDNLMRAKAAIFAGSQTLVKSVGAQCSQLDAVIIAGTFGNRINIENAITLGLLPDLPRDKFIFIGNGSLLGARLSSFSTDLLLDGQKVAGMMTNLELSENIDFMSNYTAAMFFPHTNAHETFPSVKLGGHL
jgi:uncharacterized 2Fe-2S/4Fe-4S cluster protein (DUF4445 family)